MPNAPTLLFFGTSDFALPSLRALVEDGFSVKAVFTKPDAPAGRRHALTPPPVKTEALRLGLTVVQPPKLRLDVLAPYHADIGIVVAYGLIIPRAVLQVPRLGCINLHPSLLPRFRGPSPLQTAMCDGETKTGVTIMQLDEGIDSGPIYAQEEIPIANDATYHTVQAICAERGAELVVRTLPGILAGTLKAQPQDDSKSSMTRMLTRESGRINWNADASLIERMIRAYTPWPGAWAMMGDERIKILEARVLDVSTSPGETAIMGDELLIGCGSGAIVVTKLQREGKKSMSAAEFLHGLQNSIIHFQ